MRVSPIPNMPGYFAAKDGQIYSNKMRGYPVKLRGGMTKGYRIVTVRNNSISKSIGVHRLILLTFKGPAPRGFECAHLNGVRNDNRLINLLWVSRKENHSHKKRHGTWQIGERHGLHKLTTAQVSEIRRLYRRNSYHKSNAKELAKRFRVCVSTITNITSGRNWPT